MKAILLAAGLGTRLRPLTESIPKCLIPIGGRPLLDIWLAKLKEAGINNVLINTHHLHKMVVKYIENSSYRDIVLLVHEKDLLGTAGTLMANLDFFEGRDGMLIHADNFCTSSMQPLLAAHRHRPSICDITMLSFYTNQPSKCGIVQVDDQDIVTDFEEKPIYPKGNLANGAVYVLSRSFLLKYKNTFPKATDFSNDVLKHMVGRIYSFDIRDFFIDIGTPQNYQIACSLSCGIVN